VQGEVATASMRLNSAASDEGIGQLSSSWAPAACLPETDPVATLSKRPPHSDGVSATMTGCRPGRGRGLLNLKQLQADKLAAKGKGNGRHHHSKKLAIFIF